MVCMGMRAGNIKQIHSQGKRCRAIQVASPEQTHFLSTGRLSVCLTAAHSGTQALVVVHDAALTAGLPSP